MAIPHEVHKDFSRTYGGRNTAIQSSLDSKDLREAAQKDMNILKTHLKNYGYSEKDIEAAFNKLNRLNEESGIYEKITNWLNCRYEELVQDSSFTSLIGGNTLQFEPELDDRYDLVCYDDKVDMIFNQTKNLRSLSLVFLLITSCWSCFRTTR